MKFANASKLQRKSGVRSGERGAPVRFPPTRLVRGFKSFSAEYQGRTLR
jgi:hypothetical protein